MTGPTKCSTVETAQGLIRALTGVAQHSGPLHCHSPWGHLRPRPVLIISVQVVLSCSPVTSQAFLGVFLTLSDSEISAVAHQTEWKPTAPPPQPTAQAVSPARPGHQPTWEALLMDFSLGFTFFHLSNEQFLPFCKSKETKVHMCTQLRLHFQGG